MDHTKSLSKTMMDSSSFAILRFSRYDQGWLLGGNIREQQVITPVGFFKSQRSLFVTCSYRYGVHETYLPFFKTSFSGGWEALKKTSNGSKNLFIGDYQRRVNDPSRMLAKAKSTNKDNPFSLQTGLLTTFDSNMNLYSQSRGELSSVQWYFNRSFDKTRLKRLLKWVLSQYKEKKALNVIEQLKTVGYSSATEAGISLSIDDLLIPPNKLNIILNTEQQLEQTKDLVLKGYLNSIEYLSKVVNLWNKTNEIVKQEVIKNFRLNDVLNPVYMMAFSGARGNISQVRQLVGMRGLMADPQGNIIDFPIQSNFREGLTLTEYIISCYGARKGVVDTALRTATSGYLTRRLVDVAQHVIVRVYDCGTKKGIYLSSLVSDEKTILDLKSRLVGRILAEDIYDSNSKIKIAKRNDEVTSDLAQRLVKHHKKILVRSVLTCMDKAFVCQLCYGWSLATNRLVSIGETVGIIAAQSIGEPGTQLTMRTFHTGGVFSGEISKTLTTSVLGQVQFTKSIAGKCVRTPQGDIAFLTKQEGVLFIHEAMETSVNPSSLTKNEEKSILTFLKTSNTSNTLIGDISPNAGKESLFTKVLKKTGRIHKFVLKPYTLLLVKQGDIVYPNEVLAELSSFSTLNQKTTSFQTIYSNIEGEVKFKNTEIVQTIHYPPYTNNTQLSTETGEFWVLSAQKYNLFKPISMFIQKGDFVEQNSPIVFYHVLNHFLKIQHSFLQSVVHDAKSIPFEQSLMAYRSRTFFYFFEKTNSSFHPNPPFSFHLLNPTNSLSSRTLKPQKPFLVSKCTAFSQNQTYMNLFFKGSNQILRGRFIDRAFPFFYTIPKRHFPFFLQTSVDRPRFVKNAVFGQHLRKKRFAFRVNKKSRSKKLIRNLNKMKRLPISSFSLVGDHDPTKKESYRFKQKLKGSSPLNDQCKEPYFCFLNQKKFGIKQKTFYRSPLHPFSHVKTQVMIKNQPLADKKNMDVKNAILKKRRYHKYDFIQQRFSQISRQQESMIGKTSYTYLNTFDKQLLLPFVLPIYNISHFSGRLKEPTNTSASMPLCSNAFLWSFSCFLFNSPLSKQNIAPFLPKKFRYFVDLAIQAKNRDNFIFTRQQGVKNTDMEINTSRYRNKDPQIEGNDQTMENLVSLPFEKKERFEAIEPIDSSLIAFYRDFAFNWGNITNEIKAEPDKKDFGFSFNALSHYKTASHFRFQATYQKLLLKHWIYLCKTKPSPKILMGEFVPFVFQPRPIPVIPLVQKSLQQKAVNFYSKVTCQFQRKQTQKFCFDFIPAKKSSGGKRAVGKRSVGKRSGGKSSSGKRSLGKRSMVQNQNKRSYQRVLLLKKEQIFVPNMTFLKQSQLSMFHELLQFPFCFEKTSLLSNKSIFNRSFESIAAWQKNPLDLAHMVSVSPISTEKEMEGKAQKAPGLKNQIEKENQMDKTNIYPFDFLSSKEPNRLSFGFYSNQLYKLIFRVYPKNEIKGEIQKQAKQILNSQQKKSKRKQKRKPKPFYISQAGAFFLVLKKQKNLQHAQNDFQKIPSFSVYSLFFMAILNKIHHWKYTLSNVNEFEKLSGFGSWVKNFESKTVVNDHWNRLSNTSAGSDPYQQTTRSAKRNFQTNKVNSTLFVFLNKQQIKQAQLKNNFKPFFIFSFIERSKKKDKDSSLTLSRAKVHSWQPAMLPLLTNPSICGDRPYEKEDDSMNRKKMNSKSGYWLTPKKKMQLYDKRLRILKIQKNKIDNEVYSTFYLKMNHKLTKFDKNKMLLANFPLFYFMTLGLSLYSLVFYTHYYPFFDKDSFSKTQYIDSIGFHCMQFYQHLQSSIKVEYIKRLQKSVMVRKKKILKQQKKLSRTHNNDFIQTFLLLWSLPTLSGRNHIKVNFLKLNFIQLPFCFYKFWGSINSFYIKSFIQKMYEDRFLFHLTTENFSLNHYLSSQAITTSFSGTKGKGSPKRGVLKRTKARGSFPKVATKAEKFLKKGSLPLFKNIGLKPFKKQILCPRDFSVYFLSNPFFHMLDNEAGYNFSFLTRVHLNPYLSFFPKKVTSQRDWTQEDQLQTDVQKLNMENQQGSNGNKKIKKQKQKKQDVRGSRQKKSKVNKPKPKMRFPETTLVDLLNRSQYALAKVKKLKTKYTKNVASFKTLKIQQNKKVFSKPIHKNVDLSLVRYPKQVIPFNQVHPLGWVFLMDQSHGYPDSNFYSEGKMNMLKTRFSTFSTSMTHQVFFPMTGFKFFQKDDLWFREMESFQKMKQNHVLYPLDVFEKSASTFTNDPLSLSPEKEMGNTGQQKKEPKTKIFGEKENVRTEKELGSQLSDITKLESNQTEMNGFIKHSNPFFKTYLEKGFFDSNKSSRRLDLMNRMKKEKETVQNQFIEFLSFYTQSLCLKIKKDPLKSTINLEFKQKKMNYKVLNAYVRFVFLKATKLPVIPFFKKEKSLFQNASTYTIENQYGQRSLWIDQNTIYFPQCSRYKPKLVVDSIQVYPNAKNKNEDSKQKMVIPIQTGLLQVGQPSELEHESLVLNTRKNYLLSMIQKGVRFSAGGSKMNHLIKASPLLKNLQNKQAFHPLIADKNAHISKLTLAIPNVSSENTRQVKMPAINYKTIFNPSSLPASRGLLDNDLKKSRSGCYWRPPCQGQSRVGFRKYQSTALIPFYRNLRYSIEQPSSSLFYKNHKLFFRNQMEGQMQIQVLIKNKDFRSNQQTIKENSQFNKNQFILSNDRFKGLFSSRTKTSFSINIAPLSSLYSKTNLDQGQKDKGINLANQHLDHQNIVNSTRVFSGRKDPLSLTPEKEVGSKDQRVVKNKANSKEKQYLSIVKQQSPMKGEVIDFLNLENKRDKILLNQPKISQVRYKSDPVIQVSYLTKRDMETYGLLNSKDSSPSIPWVKNVGSFVSCGDKVTRKHCLLRSGQIIYLTKNKLILRHAQCFLLSSGSFCPLENGEYVSQGSPLLTVSYSNVQTQDIIQGIPKIDQLFEAKNRPGFVNLHQLLEDKYASLQVEDKSGVMITKRKAVLDSVEYIQKYIVDAVQNVYQSQGVNISDKHVEIIVKQMTSKVRVYTSLGTGYLRGDTLSLNFVEMTNLYAENKTFECRPMLLGISQASLQVGGFISAASFQETIRVLSKSAVLRKIDFLKGLKENIIVGHLLSAGTGFDLPI